MNRIPIFATMACACAASAQCTDPQQSVIQYGLGVGSFITECSLVPFAYERCPCSSGGVTCGTASINIGTFGWSGTWSGGNGSCGTQSSNASVLLPSITFTGPNPTTTVQVVFDASFTSDLPGVSNVSTVNITFRGTNGDFQVPWFQSMNVSLMPGQSGTFASPPIPIIPTGQSMSLEIAFSAPLPTFGFDSIAQSGTISLAGTAFVTSDGAVANSAESRIEDNQYLGPEPVCQADVNADGVLDNGDISAFVTLFLAGDPAADFTGDGLLDNGDIGAFVTAFLAGC